MSDRPTIVTLPAGARYDTSSLNSNFQALRDAHDNLISTVGVGGSNNSMLANFDMNGFKIINVGSILSESGADLALEAGYAEEWANKAVDSLVSTSAGGDQVDDYSSLHWATKASADVDLTNADVLLTNADVVSTGNDVTSLTGVASTSSLEIAVASKAFTVASGLSLQAGDWVICTSDANPDTNYMHGPIATYSGTTLTVAVDNIGGSGTLSDWTIRRSGTQGATGDTGATGPTGPFAGNLDDIGDVTIATPTSGQALTYNGSIWVNGSGGGGLFGGNNGATGSSSGDIFRINAATLTANEEIETGLNASCTGPLSIDTGVTLTVSGTLVVL